MLPIDLIIAITKYSSDFNYYYLNKSLYETIILIEEGMK